MGNDKSDIFDSSSTSRNRRDEKNQMNNRLCKPQNWTTNQDTKFTYTFFFITEVHVIDNDLSMIMAVQMCFKRSDYDDWSLLSYLTTFIFLCFCPSRHIFCQTG